MIKKKMMLAMGLLLSMSLFGCQNSTASQNKVPESVAIVEESRENTVFENEEYQETSKVSWFTCENAQINALAEQVIILAENEEIEDQSWIADNFCYRISIGYVETPKDTYKHKKDYFLFTGVTIPYFEVEYAKNNDDPNKKCVYDACDFHIVQEDVTFDGYDDLLIFLVHTGAQGAEIYCAYIFDAEKEEYVYAPSFEEISNYKVDQQRLEIVSQNRSNAVSDNITSYRYFKSENSFQKISE